MAKQHASIDYAAYAVLRVVIAFVQALPLSLCDRGAKGLAWLFTHVLRPRQKLVDNNLQVAFPKMPPADRKQLVEQMWRHLFLMVCEIAHTPRKIHRTTWRRFCRLKNEQLVVATMIRDEPCVLISGHYGNFELGGYMLGLFGFPTHTVARTIDNPYVDQFVNEFRGRTGQYILPKQGSRDEVERVMEQGGALTLLGDQSAGARGCWVDFFGKKASTHKAVSLFTLGYNAPTLVVGVQRLQQPLNYEISIPDHTDPNAEGFPYGTTTLLTEWFTQALQQIICRAPEQYWWVHNRWKGQPPQRRKPKKPHIQQQDLSSSESRVSN